MGRKSRKKRERREAKNPRQRFRPNTEYERPVDPATPSEGYLRRLCDRSFLTLWSYPNLFQEPGKELCDTLIAFERTIILFSVKHCEFPNTGNLDLDWRRWYRRAIKKSAHQLFQAERWLRTQPGRLFVDAKCTKPFPLPLKVDANTVFHRVVVAHGASDRCRDLMGGSGSLMLSTDIVGDDHDKPREQGGSPFMVGQVDVVRGYVHVLGDTTLDVVLKSLDTVVDFTTYLDKKQRFLEATSVTAAGEEELLAYYLTHLNEAKEYDFVFDLGFTHLSIAEGHWDNFLTSPQRASKRKADGPSYAWDDIIERTLKHFRQGTAHHTSSTLLADEEAMLRQFARLSRVKRRSVVESLFDMLDKTRSPLHRRRVMLPSRSGDPYIVLVVMPRPPEQWRISYEQYRTVRRNLLEMCCFVVKSDYPEAEDIIGLAIDGYDAGSQGMSEDLLYMDTREWAAEAEAEARRYKRTLGIFTTGTMVKDTVYDYPINDGK